MTREIVRLFTRVMYVGRRHEVENLRVAARCDLGFRKEEEGRNYMYMQLPYVAFTTFLATFTNFCDSVAEK